MRLVVGISGSSSPIYGIRTLEALKAAGVETHLVVSSGARRTIELETTLTVEQVCALATVVYDERDMAATISSGSFRTDGMVVVPCSMKAAAAIAHSFVTDLLVRAADVTLKEGRKLVLVPRETPLHLGHLRLAAQLTEIGGVVMPPVPAFYTRPETVDDIVDETVGRVLGRLGFPVEGLVEEWPGDVLR